MRKGRSKYGDRIGFPRSISELVPNVGRKAFRRFGFTESAVVARWPEIVGSELSGCTSPDQIRFPQGRRSGGTLCLSVLPAQALRVQHSEPDILDRVNRYFGYGAVARLSIRQAALDPPPAEEKRRQAATADDVDVGARSDLKGIEDEGLRTTLEALAAEIGRTSGPPKIG